MSAGGLALLFVPADRPERFARAAASGADSIIIDLEDAVAPAAKSAARAALAAPGALPGGIEIFLRVNAAGTPWHAEDLACAARLPLAGIVLPKAEAPERIAAVSQAAGGPPVIALIETARGLAEARRLAAAGVARLAFGSIDFCADLGAAHTREALLHARAELVLAARLAALPPPIDGVTTAIDDEAAIEDDARHAASLGFGGKLCIHPRQIAPARQGFRPSAAELAWAQRILAAGPDGAEAVDGAMVDAPVRARARQIARRAGIPTS
ncbi:MAG: CoA ester lyase [Rhodospirillales bacterium]|uniref:HpcH/HpaI aldolase/citrate lyase family protein n=1 Tax=Acidiphilium sp. TaxID=527 RepID=UPI00239A2B59|nr:CoA ester lyase [Acidiphilium sp.]MDE2326522.1 CoA ester lyase [Rhodospirillales bacterium]